MAVVVSAMCVLGTVAVGVVTWGVLSEGPCDPFTDIHTTVREAEHLEDVAVITSADGDGLLRIEVRDALPGRPVFVSRTSEPVDITGWVSIGEFVDRPDTAERGRLPNDFGDRLLTIATERTERTVSVEYLDAQPDDRSRC